tara:strand:- start:5489 stop:6316 length:828 start_codon:yes stop_codon:yes gene_type:complete
MGYLNAIVFLGYIVYNYLTGSILTPKNDAYWITAICMFILSIGLLTYGNYDKDNGINWFVLITFIVILFLGYGSNAYNMSKLKNASDTHLEHYQNKTNISTSLFLICGLFAYILNYYEGDRCYTPEFLCNKNMIMMFVLVNISIYQFVHTFRLMGNKTLYTTDKDTDVSNTGIFNIAILCLWQFYIYFLSDGFTDGKILSNMKQTGSGNKKTMYEIFSALSIFVIAGFLGTNIALTYECDKWKNNKMIDDVKEISYNMVCTTVTTIIILTLFRGN